MQVPPFYSSAFLAPQVHHNQSTCSAGDQIPTPYMRSGTRDYQLCSACAEIAAVERRALAS